MLNSKRPRLGVRLIVALALVVVLPAALTGMAFADPGHGKGKGKGKGREKVTLCHKGVRITVGRPAVAAHLRHGDTLGACQATAATGRATITVFKHVVSDSGGKKGAADFTITVNGVAVSGGNSFAGSELGVTRTVTSFGAYSVSESSVTGYALASASAGCAGTISPGEQKTCTLTNDDVPATITVIKHAINNGTGTKGAGDFTLTINSVTAVGGNSFAGSEAGVTKTLATVGTYSVTETAVTGYAQTGVSADCTGAIALGEHKTCTITNDDV